MSKFRFNQSSLMGGELAPSALGRSDLPMYKHSCETLQNMIPLVGGGAYRRPGTLFQASYPVSTDYAPRLIPFVASPSEAYLIVLRKSTVDQSTSFSSYRVTSNLGLTGPPHTVGTCTGNHPYNALNTYSNYDEWQYVQYAQSVDVLTLVHPNHKPQRIYRTALDTFIIGGFDADSTGAIPNGADFRDAWPYLNQNTTTDTMTIDATGVGGLKTLTHKNAGGTATAFFYAGHVGAVFKVYDGTNYAAYLVTAVAGDGKSATVTCYVSANDTAAHATWWESAWSDYRGWPSTVCYYQGRILYASTRGTVVSSASTIIGAPDSIWHSKINNYNIMSVAALTISDSAGDGSTSGPKGVQPFTSVLSSPQLNAIQWMNPQRNLLVGTERNEWIIDRPDGTQAYAIDNRSATISSSFGSDYVRPAQCGVEVIFAFRSQHELKSLVFNQIYNSYIDEAVQSFYGDFPYAEGVYTFGARKFRHICWDSTRSTLWCTDTAGNLRGLTRDRLLQVNAWHSHVLGGTDSTKTGGAYSVGATADPIYNSAAGSVVSICMLPNPSHGVDDLWMVVKRYQNGVYAYHLERMIGENWPNSSAYLGNVNWGPYTADASAATFFSTNPPTPYNLNYLSHLIGASPIGIGVNTNGIFYITGATVDGSGNSALNKQYPVGMATLGSQITAGLPFTSIVKTTRIEAGSQIGTAQGAIKRIHEIVTRFYRTIYAKVGRDAASSLPVNFRAVDCAMGKGTELFTGDKIQKFTGTYDRDGYVYIYSDHPLPMAVSSISIEGVTSDG